MRKRVGLYHQHCVLRCVLDHEMAGRRGGRGAFALRVLELLSAQERLLTPWAHRPGSRPREGPSSQTGAARQPVPLLCMELGEGTSPAKGTLSDEAPRHLDDHEAADNGLCIILQRRPFVTNGGARLSFDGMPSLPRTCRSVSDPFRPSGSSEQRNALLISFRGSAVALHKGNCAYDTLNPTHRSSDDASYCDLCWLGSLRVRGATGIDPPIQSALGRTDPQACHTRTLSGARSSPHCLWVHSGRCVPPTGTGCLSHA